MKERLTITLDSELLKKLDATIDGVNVRNRSHAIERLLDIVLAQNKPKKAVVLAGGHPIKAEGKDEIPKPMVMVRDRPILEYVIRELKRNGISDILIIIGRGGEKITRYFGDGTLFGIKISYIKEDAPRGTESALELAKGIVGDSPFFVINGDNIFKINLLDMYDQHTKTHATATIALATSDVPAHFGVSKLEGSRITSFEEKPGIKHGSALVSAGVYVFSPSVFSLVSVGNKPTMLEKSLLPKLAEAGRLDGYVFSTPWTPLETQNMKESVKKLENVAGRLSGS